MLKKYELTSETKVVSGKTLYRIRALVAFGDVEAGELGGWVECEANLSQSDTAWVYDHARVFGAARVFNNAQVCGDAQVYDYALVYGNAEVYGNAQVFNNAQVYGDALVYDQAQVYGYALARGYAKVYGNARLCGNAETALETHLFQLGAIGSRNDFTTFFRTEDERLFVSCGCFCGPVNEFKKKVRQTHGNNKHAKAYALAIKLAKLQVEDVEVQ